MGCGMPELLEMPSTSMKIPPSNVSADSLDELIARQPSNRALERAFYMDPAMFERDMRCIVRRHWMCAGHASALPNHGDYCVVNIESEAVVLTRDGNGAIHAFLNVCRHRGAEVCTRASGNTKYFVCPYHAWTYRLDGSLHGARNMPADFDKAAHGLRRVHVRVAEGLIFISFAEHPLDFGPVERMLSTTCGRYGWGAAKIAFRQSYPVEANWKLAVENYVECYHCAPAHPEYSKVHALEQPLERIEELTAQMQARTRALGVDLETGNHWQSSAEGQEAIHSFRYPLYGGASTGSQDGSPLAPLMGQFTAYDGGVTSIHLGGLTFLVCYPDHGMIYRFVPRSPHTCEMELIWLVRGDAREGIDYDLDKLTWMWKVTTEADKRIIEHAARGVRSHFFRPGPLAPMEYNERRYLDWYLQEVAR
jgi:phenylpropionate dioxygenase-like ring-hydroxylating dioxygenase large terminal subunit